MISKIWILIKNINLSEKVVPQELKKNLIIIKIKGLEGACSLFLRS